MSKWLSTASLARTSARHPWRTIVLWCLCLVIAIVLSSLLLQDVLTSEVGFAGTPESQRGSDLIEDRLHIPRQSEEIIIVRAPPDGGLTVDDAEFRSTVETLYDEILALGPSVIESGLTYYRTGAEALVSGDRRTTIMPLVMAGDLDDAESHIDRVRAIVNRADRETPFTILITGDASLSKDWMEVAERDLRTAEFFGIPIAVVVLVIVFGAVVAAFLPLIVGFFAILIAVGLTALIGQGYEFSVFVTNMIVAMGLSLGIDYSLFIVSRYREERRCGAEKLEAIEAAGGTASRAVFFSGVTVVLALFGMLMVPMTLFRSLASGAILAVSLAVCASLTLLPAILSLLGDRINALRIPLPGQKKTAPSAEGRSGFWDWATRRVMRRPVLSLFVAVAILIAAAIPILSMELGAAGVSTLPESIESKEGYRILQEDFSFGLLTPAKIVIVGPIADEAVQEGIARLTDTIESDPAFFGEPSLQIGPEGDIALISAPVMGDPTGPEAIRAVKALRRTEIPAAFAGTGARVYVTGSTAIHMDYIRLTGDYMPVVFGFVLGLSFALLTLVFRSIVVPIKAILMNLLSVGATYGLVVLVFQKGIGADLLGFQQIDTFEAWVPIFLFCILFGLSMDYHVFLLSRIREHYDATQDNAEAVAFGLRTTGGIITGAALIMVVVFSAFAAGDLVMFQQMGFGLAVAVLLDASVIRSVIVPSAMRLLGNLNWYLPGWLEWLPRIRAEGGPDRDRSPR